MRKPLRIALWTCGGVLVAVLLALLAIYLAVRHVPDAYRRVLQADPAAQAKASDAMVRRSLDLQNAVRRPGKWQARFTADEINGWFAVDMKKNHPDLLPAEFSEPRVTIAPDEMRLYCRFRRGGVESVLSLAVDVYLAEPDMVALRIRRARAGALPVPLAEVTDRIRQQAARRPFPLRWRQAEGDPVALVPLDLRDKERGWRVRVEALELRDGEIYVSGTSGK